MALVDGRAPGPSPTGFHLLLPTETHGIISIDACHLTSSSNTHTPFVISFTHQGPAICQFLSPLFPFYDPPEYNERLKIYDMK